MKSKFSVMMGIFLALPAFVAEAQRDSKPIYFDIDGRNVGSSKIMDARILFADFQFIWGGMESLVVKSYAQDIPRLPPSTVTLNWQNAVTGKQTQVEVSVPDLPERFNGAGSHLVNGKRQNEGLLLRLDIDSDTETACAVWTDESYPSDDVRCR